MPKRIRIGEMGLTTTESTLFQGFNDYGSIVSYSIDRDLQGQSLGVGHIQYATAQAGTAAIAAKHNTLFDGSVITVVSEDPPQ